MVCAYCERKIPPKDVAAGRYSRSAYTGNRYCVRTDCMTVGKRLRKKREAGEQS